MRGGKGGGVASQKNQRSPPLRAACHEPPTAMQFKFGVETQEEGVVIVRRDHANKVFEEWALVVAFGRFRQALESAVIMHLSPI